jgi:repressor LexA
MPPSSNYFKIKTVIPNGRDLLPSADGIVWMAIETPDEPDPGHVLTWRQRKVLQVIRESIRKRGYPPSMQEIGDAVGLTSQSSVSYQIATLESKGYLRRDGRRPRTVEVRLPGHQPVRHDAGAAARPRGDGLDIPSQEAARVPLIGRMAAAGPILEPGRVEAVMPLARKLVGDGTLFMFTMAGDSMVNAAIVDGDWVVVRQQAHASDGDIVAAMIGGEATVRTFKRTDGNVWLMPNNPACTPVPGDGAVILGKVVAIIRSVDREERGAPAG